MTRQITYYGSFWFRTAVDVRSLKLVATGAEAFTLGTRWRLHPRCAEILHAMLGSRMHNQPFKAWTRESLR